jgi:RNA polymerase sigma-70 factor (ECF subfamily)
MESNNDQVYIDKILNGEVNAYSFLIDKYKDMVYTIANKILRNREDAEEVAQDTFMKAYQKLDTFKGDSRFSTWLYSIVYRTAISKVRKKEVSTSAIDNYVIVNHSTDQDPYTLKEEEQRYYVNKIINLLPETDAALITLYYLNENSVEEISEITGLSNSNIKVKLFRIRKKLYAELSVLLKEEIRSIV